MLVQLVGMQEEESQRRQQELSEDIALKVGGRVYDILRHCMSNKKMYIFLPEDIALKVVFSVSYAFHNHLLHLYHFDGQEEAETIDQQCHVLRETPGTRRLLVGVETVMMMTFLLLFLW